MDKELYSLVLGYRECLEKISELNSETVRENVDLRRSSIEQQLFADHCKSESSVPQKVSTADTSKNMPEARTVNKKLDEIIGKLKLDNDKVLNKQLMDAEAAKLGVQVYLDNVIWKLFSRTELLNNALLFNNDLNRINDKKCLMKLMETFIHIDRETQTNFVIQGEEEVEQEDQRHTSKEMDQFLADLHSWMLHVSAIYLRLCTTDEKKYIVELLSKTTHIADWAMPMIQFKMEKMSKADDYVAILKLVLSNSHSDPLMEDNRLHWTEDDYLAVIEQLAIDYNLLNVIDNLPSDINPQMLFILCQKLADALMTAIQLLKPMKMLAKRLSQIVTHISVLLVDTVIEKEWPSCQQHIDLFISQLVKGFYDMEGGSGWSFLANIKYDALSINALWDITLHMLHINTNIIPSATSDVLNDNLPSTTRFQYELQENQTQGYFLLNCLANIILSIPSLGFDHINCVNNSEDVLRVCTIIIISYTLFMIAFVDKQLREHFYKDVRDNFSHITRKHTFTISLLFQWSAQHISIMERMAIYLFRSIDLQSWHILRDDLQHIHQLLILSPTTTANNNMSPKSGQQQQPTPILFARYILEHLNYGLRDDTVESSDISKAQPWYDRKMPFLTYDIHEEIASILLDACQQYLPLPDSMSNDETKNDGNSVSNKRVENSSSYELSATDGMHTLSTHRPTKSTICDISDSGSKNTKRSKLSTSSRNSSVNAPEFIDWAWTIVMQLKLFDCPSSPRANDMEATIDISFLRQVLNHPHPATASHGALLIYISFMLSTTSRHFLRFETAHGWMKLLVLLRRSNKPEVLIQILSEIIPSFVYMHGDDFFNDESWNDLLKQMVDFKADPMLIQAGGRMMRVIQQQQQQLRSHQRSRKSRNTKIFGDNTTGIGFIMFSNFWHAHLIDSVSHLLDEKGKGFSYVDLVMHSWLKSIFKRHDWMWHQAYVGMMDTLCQTAWTLRNKNRLVHHMLLEEYKRIQKAKEQYNANSPRLSRMLKNMVIPEDAVATLIIGEWSVLRTTNTFNKSTPGIENRLFWFAFEALMVETTAEQSLREEIAEVIQKQLSKEQLQHQQNSQKRSFDIASVHKQTASHAKKPIEYFAIYRWLQHILIMPFDHPLLPLYLQMFFSLYYQAIVESGNISISGGTLFFEKKQDLIQKLQNYIANLQTYHGQKLTTTYNSSDNTASLYVETLQQLYYAMWLWLGNAELTELKADFHDLPTLYDPPRLGKIYARKEQEQPWVTNEVWLDVIDLNYLERTFLAFPWAGASKFNKKRDEKELCQQSLRSKSSSANIVASSASSLSIPTSTTTRRGVRILTDESVIKPLPPLCINEPTTTSTGSISKRLKK